jgi:hypothetical protein
MNQMSKRTYIITFDPLSPVDLQTIVKRVKGAPDFAEWWHHIPFVFLVTSDLNADQIAEHLRPDANGSSFLVMQVDPGDSEGLLPKQAWSWIKSQERLQEDVGTRRAFESQHQA